MHKINLLDSKFSHFSAKQFFENFKSISYKISAILLFLVLLLLASEYYISMQLSTTTNEIKNLRQFATISGALEKNYQKILNIETLLKSLRNAPVSYVSRYRRLLELTSTAKLLQLNLRNSGEFSLELEFNKFADFETFSQINDNREKLRQDFESIIIPSLTTASSSAPIVVNLRGKIK